MKWSDFKKELSVEYIKYPCVENDNTLIITKEDGKIREISVGCSDVPDDGWSIIGFDDLEKALSLADKKIVDKEDIEGQT